MTKKDFIVVARAIKLQVDRYQEVEDSNGVEAINRVMWELIREFHGVNPRFDEQRFINACGF